MEGEGLCPAGSCGVYRKDRLMCRKRMQDFLGTQWQEQRHVSEELGTVRINWNRDFIYWRERKPNWRVD